MTGSRFQESVHVPVFVNLGRSRWLLLYERYFYLYRDVAKDTFQILRIFVPNGYRQDDIVLHKKKEPEGSYRTFWYIFYLQRIKYEINYGWSVRFVQIVSLTRSEQNSATTGQWLILIIWWNCSTEQCREMIIIDHRRRPTKRTQMVARPDIQIKL